jgi:hypothetical protein
MMAKPTTEQLAKINQLALVPLSEDQVYVFPAKVIGDNLIPKLKMRLSSQFLQKMADQAKQGVSLLIDHPWTKWEAKSIPYGRTFDSRLQMDGNELSMYADHYMVMGQEFDGIKTDDLAASIDAGTIFDTSAGFIVSECNCSLCGLSYYNSPCPHLAGVEYDAGVCEKIAMDGQLMENSLVFDGAYEGAGIGMSKSSGPSKEKNQEFVPLESTTKTIDGDSRIFYAFSQKSGVQAFVLGNQSELPKEEESMNDKERADKAELALSQKEVVLTKVNTTLEGIRAALKVNSDEEIAGTLSVLSKNAELGHKYASKVIDEACGAGVRALGQAFNTDAMKMSFSNLPVEEVEKIRDTFEAQAKAALGGGGQHTSTPKTDLPANPETNPNATVTLSADEQKAQAESDAKAALKRRGLLKEEAR